MDPIDITRSGELVWFHERGYGYVHPVEDEVYGQDYYSEYQKRAESEVNEPLMKERIAFVKMHYDGDLVDIGAGYCAFIEARNKGLAHPNTYGYDVMPQTVKRLLDANLFWNPFEKKRMEAASFWDVLEHFINPDKILSKIKKWVFISIPIFRDAAHIMSSKHFKPGEHIWMFSERGLVEYMDTQGFMLRGGSEGEKKCGREDIGMYAFERILLRVTEGATCQEG